MLSQGAAREEYRFLKHPLRTPAVAFLCMLASGCVEEVRLEELDVSPVVEKAPLKVAVIYDQTLRNHHCSACKGYIAAEWMIALGPPSIKAFTPIFSSMFDDVVILNTGEERQVGEDRYIIRLSLQDYTGCDVSWPIVGSSVEVAYSADVTRRSEKVLSNWTGQGQATAQDYYASPGKGSLDIEGQYLARTTEIAVRKAVGDFLWKFEEDERVRAWVSAALAEERDDQ